MTAQDRSKALLTLIIKLTRQYLNLPVEKTAEAIQHSLEEMGRFVQADRAYIFSYDMQAMTCSNTYEWCEVGVQPEIDNLQNFDMNAIPEWIDAHIQGNEMYVPNVQALNKSSNLYQLLNSQGIKSIMTTPMRRANDLVGFVGFDSVKSHHQYSEEERSLLQLYAELLVNIELRKEAVERVYFERDRAEKASKDKSLFLANMSHEIRTPLNAIIGFTDLLTDTKLNAQQREFMSTIDSSGQLLLGIVNDILDLSKIEAGKLNLIMQSTSIHRVIQQVASMLADSAAQKGLELEVNTDISTEAMLITDKTRLTQVLMNLISNAIKYTDDGRILVSATAEKETREFTDIRFEVSDTGVGIADDALAHLFTPFKQVHNSHEADESGAGLGLSISQRIVQALGGSIQVDSRPGQGTIFSFVLTFKKAGYSQSKNVRQATTTDGFNYPEWRSLRILIAEDVHVNQRLLTYFLEPTGCTFVFANTGEEATELALEHKFDLIIMDIQLPGIDGYKTTEQILRAKPDSQIIAFSAAVSDEDIRQFQQLGMHGYIPKPVTREDFFHKLADVTKKRQ